MVEVIFQMQICLFFEEKGCEVTNYDFGIEEFEVKKVSDGPIKKKKI